MRVIHNSHPILHTLHMFAQSTLWSLLAQPFYPGSGFVRRDLKDECFGAKLQNCLFWGSVSMQLLGAVFMEGRGGGEGKAPIWKLLLFSDKFILKKKKSQIF